MPPQVIRPEQPEFFYNDNFPGNFRPRPVFAKTVDPEAIRTTLNAYRDNFEAQKRFSRDLRMDITSTNKRIDRVLDYLCAVVVLSLLALGVAILR